MIDNPIKFSGSERWLSEQVRAIENHPIIRHPFLEAFKNGKLTKEQVVAWLSQTFYASISLPSSFAAIYARVPDRLWNEKRKLIPLLDIEAWGSEDPGAHSVAFKHLADYLHLNLDELTNKEPAPYTKRFLALRLDICVNPKRPVSQGLAAIALGNELLNAHIYAAYREGINKVKGLENAPTDYLDAHVRDEEADFHVFADLFDKVVSSGAEQEVAAAGLKEFLIARTLFFNALADDLGVAR